MQASIRAPEGTMARGGTICGKNCHLGSSAAAFSRTDYFSLAERAATSLGNELVAEDEWLVHPGQTRELTRVLDPATRHLGLLVGYREIDRAQWRLVLEPKQGTLTHYRIDLGINAASAAELAAPSRLDSR